MKIFRRISWSARSSSIATIISVLILTAGAQETPAGDRDHELRRALNELLEAREEIKRLSSELTNLKMALKEQVFRVMMERYRLPSERLFLCGEPIPIERKDIFERLEREFLISVGDVPQVILWLKRANRVFPYIMSVLRERGLPEDLKYLAVAESALRPQAISRKGAGGYWQFIPSVGEKYELKVNRWIDERFDLVKSTDAAANYLNELYSLFGSWTLSMAAYNAGKGRILAEIEKQGIRDYYQLKLPEETERYIFRIASAKIIISNPERYGFFLEKNELYSPTTWERIEIHVKSGNLDLLRVARALGITFKEFKDMNPHLRDEELPKGIYRIQVPPGKEEMVRKALQPDL